MADKPENRGGVQLQLIQYLEDQRHQAEEWWDNPTDKWTDPNQPKTLGKAMGQADLD